jgi:hypothetical protein
MSGAELLDQLNRAGGWIEIVDGKPRIRGAKVSAELMDALRANREAVLAEMERQRAEDRDRYCKIPSSDAPIMARDTVLNQGQHWLLERYCFQQGRVVHAWVMRRANEYHGLGIDAGDCEWRACLDLIAWQRQTSAEGAVEFVVGLDEAHKFFSKPPEPKPETQEEKKG